MQTLVIDIINNKAVRLLYDLEQLELIRVHKQQNIAASINWESKYKGTMTKQPLSDIEDQLTQLRNEWE